MSSERKISSYLRELSRNLRAGPLEKRRILIEVRDHMLHKVESQRSAGADSELAQEKAISEFGDPAKAAIRLHPPPASMPTSYEGGAAPPGRRGLTLVRASQARAIPLLYGGIAGVLLVVIAAMALVLVPPSPPQVAEFAPVAQEQIQEANGQQSSQFAGTADACGENRDCELPGGMSSGSSAKRIIEKARVRRCIGDPPRQTEDPQSPPCVNYFQGNNGGSVSRGVTRDEIRVAVVVPPPAYDSWAKAVVERLVAHFNQRYEFYGRRLSPVFVEARPWDDPVANSAATEKLLETNSFAAVSTLNLATNAAIHRRLAQERVISVVSYPPGFNSGAVTDGFTWLVDPPLDVRLRAGASFVCRALTGRPASHAGQEFASDERKFAVIVRTERSGVRPDESLLRQGLQRCGAEFEVVDLPFPATDSQRDAVMLKLRSERFTTVLTVSSAFSIDLQFGASRVGYFPEWMDLALWSAHSEVMWSGGGQPFTAPHASHAFGITSDVRVRPDAEVPAIWALRESGGDINPSQIYVEPWYASLLVLASGIQEAGPRLNPETFADGLRTTKFPNPRPGASPHWQQRIGFGPGDPVFHDDYAVWWWNGNAPSQTGDSRSGRGSFCYLDRGGRFAADGFPTNADGRLFSSEEPCR